MVTIVQWNVLEYVLLFLCILLGATRTIINESGLKYILYILVTKMYDEWESYDDSHAATFSEQWASSLPSNPANESLVKTNKQHY